MVAAASTAFCWISLLSDASTLKPDRNVGWLSVSAHIRGIRQKTVTSKFMQVRANAQTPPQVNGTRVAVMDGLKSDEEISCSPPPRAFIKQLPGWNMLLAIISTISWTAERQQTVLGWKPKRPDDPFGLGRIVQNGLIFSQNFSIRSYEIGADGTVSVETLLNHLQETALNHLKHLGLLGDGLGSTPEMCKRNLIWVVAKMQVMVDRYPTWGDVVQVDTWIAPFGKNCVRRDWVFRDYDTGEILARASSCYVTMNKQTRKLTKLPDDVRAELETYFVDAPHAVEEDKRKFPKLTNTNADYIQSGLTPSWSDLDVNQHVNNVKYVGWILESAPQAVVESHELASMTLEYKKECKWDNVLDSLLTCSILRQGTDGWADYGEVECQHLLRLKDGADIIKGRTMWRPKPTAYGYGSSGQLPAETA
ncbi:palmitoyl-acyl carrier protein thioesterase, chloroplastic-like [Apium graveolens]|uniref:palmitoyl-acyl carrier protein thioesterase, chloroplastic-like n=1 Tax=Apium graveolens TaxID=4045 RepID=UPI003D7A838A